MSEPQPRVRVTATGSFSGADNVGSGSHTTDPQSLYVRSLIRSQLLLAIYCVGGFLILLATFVTFLGLFPVLDEQQLGGIGARWWLLGVGVYPLLITTGAIYARAARRNEARYRSLIDTAES